MIKKYISRFWKKHFLKFDYVLTPEEKNKKALKKLVIHMKKTSDNLEDFWVKNLRGSKTILPEKQRKLAVRYTFAEDNISWSHHAGLTLDDLEEEILTALSQEIDAELLQELLGEMKQCGAQVIGIYDQDQELKDLYQKSQVSSIFSVISENFEHAKQDGATWAIVSPTALMIIKMHDKITLNQTTQQPSNMHTTQQPSNMHHVGQYHGIELYCDAYATDRAPIILGRPDAFVYSGEGFKIGPSIIDPTSFEPWISFSSTYSFIVDKSKLSLIEFKLWGLGCFL